MASSTSRKGQYFSFDAIIASVIFILAISLLSAHWYALRAQIDSSSDYVGADAMRVSDLLLGVGNPVDYALLPDQPIEANCLSAGSASNWYMCPGQAVRAGFSINNSPIVLLNATQLYQAQQYVGALNPSSSTLNANHYDAYRSLMAIGSQFDVMVNTSELDRTGHPVSYRFGRSPVNATEIAQARRSIVIFDSTKPVGERQYYYGNLTVYVWSNQTRP